MKRSYRFYLTFQFLLLFIFILTLHAIAQTRSRRLVFNEILELINEYPAELKTPDSGIGDMIRELQYDAEGPVTDEMIAYFEKLADDEVVYPTTRAAAIRALYLSKPADQLERLRSLMAEDDPYAAIPAAALMVTWGFWDEGSKVLVDHEVWTSLSNVGDSLHVVPVLLLAVSDRTKSRLSRLNAAVAMGAFGDTTLKYSVARTLLAPVLSGSEQCTDTADFARCFSVAENIFDRSSVTGDVNILESALYFPDYGVQTSSLFALSRRARVLGDRNAVEVIRQAASQDVFAKIKDEASRQLETLGQLEMKQ